MDVKVGSRVSESRQLKRNDAVNQDLDSKGRHKWTKKQKNKQNQRKLN